MTAKKKKEDSDGKGGSGGSDPEEGQEATRERCGVEPEEGSLRNTRTPGGEPPVEATAAVVASAGSNLPAYKDQVGSRDNAVGQRQKGNTKKEGVVPASPPPATLAAQAAALPSFKDQVRECRRNDGREEEEAKPAALEAQAAALPSFKDQVRECRRNDGRDEEAGTDGSGHHSESVHEPATGLTPPPPAAAAAAAAVPPATRPGAAFVNSRGVVSSQATYNHPLPQECLVSAILVRPSIGVGGDTNLDVAVFTAEPLRRWTRNRIIVFFAILAAATAVAVTTLAVLLGKDEPVDPATMPVSPTPAPDTTESTPPTGPLETKLTASDGAANDRFGWSVAISGDMLVIGAFADDDNKGSAYIYSRSDTTMWTEQAKLTASDGAANDQFGCNVAIDGDTIAVGAILDDDSGRDRGSAFIYSKSDTVWTQQVKLTASDGAPTDYFGVTVAVSGDTVVVGAGGGDDNGLESGSAYVFLRSGATTWTEQAKLMASDGAAGDWLGISVAISGDTMVVGAYLDGDNSTNIGSAYIYTRTGTEWTEQAKLTASDAAEKDWFGRSVAISDDTVVIGAPRHDGDRGSNSGSAYVFLPLEATWTEQVKLTANDAAADDEFGWSVGVHGDTVVIGAFHDDDNGSNTGSTYVYTRSVSAWTEQAKLTANNVGAADDEFGWSVAVHGESVVVGSWGANDEDIGDDSGSVYVFDLNI